MTIHDDECIYLYSAIGNWVNTHIITPLRGETYNVKFFSKMTLTLKIEIFLLFFAYCALLGTSHGHVRNQKILYV